MLKKLLNSYKKRAFLGRHKKQKAENALKYYKGFKGNCQYETAAFQAEFDRMQATSKQRKRQMKFHFSDFCKVFTYIFFIFWFRFLKVLLNHIAPV